MKHQIVSIVLACCSLTAMAQGEPEYRLEVGAGAGMATYTGDFNDGLLQNINPLGELVVKYKPNPRMAWALNVGYTTLKGDSRKSKTWYPELAQNPLDFSTSLYDVAVRFEYNFWPFGTGKEYHGAKRLTPFVAIGLGLAISKSDLTQGEIRTNGSSVGGQMPIGLGVKYKVANRLNLTAEWMMHFTGNDKLDGVEDPYGIKSTGLFKNTDCFSVLAVTLTYDLWAKCKTCHNDRD